MRIALVYRHFDLTRGVPARSHVELARYLVNAGHDVHVYSIASTRDVGLVPSAVFHDVPVATVSKGRIGLALEIWSFDRNVARLLAAERRRFDFVHARAPSTWRADILHLPGVVSGEIRRHLDTRGPVGLGRRIKDAARPVARPVITVRSHLERRAMESPELAQVHVDSRQVRDDLVAAYEIQPDQILVVPPGVNLDEFRPPDDRGAVRLALRLPESATLILFCGHSFQRKGLDRAILALARMREPARLVVVGGGDPKAYSALAETAGVLDRVHFAGARSDAWRFYQAADVVTLPTRVDMWGSSVVEAMATGVPPVTTSAAGASEVVDDGRTGFVLPEPLDIDFLAATFDRLAHDAELRRRIGAAARERARALSWQEHGRRVEAAMSMLLRPTLGSEETLGSSGRSGAA